MTIGSMGIFRNTPVTVAKIIDEHSAILKVLVDIQYGALLNQVIIDRKYREKLLVRTVYVLLDQAITEGLTTGAFYNSDIPMRISGTRTGMVENKTIFVLTPIN